MRIQVGIVVNEEPAWIIREARQLVQFEAASMFHFLSGHMNRACQRHDSFSCIMFCSEGAFDTCALLVVCLLGGVSVLGITPGVVTLLWDALLAAAQSFVSQISQIYSSGILNNQQ